MKNTQLKNILYSYDDAQALTHSEQTESWRLETDRKKADLILQYADGAQSLLDIGCGGGQVLRHLAGKIPVLAGVDESEDRLARFRDNDLGIKVYHNSMTKLDVDDGSFDIVLTSHVMHELKLFGLKDDFLKAFKEIKRVLAPAGRYFMIDHADSGEGAVTLKLQDKQMKLLRQFKQKFNYRSVDAKMEGALATLSRADAHDFITKIWAMGTGAEKLEMKETHTIMKKEELEKDLEAAGFRLDQWIPFNSIGDLMQYYSIELVRGQLWDRQFMLIAGIANKKDC